jgi:hypothetical protein
MLAELVPSFLETSPEFDPPTSPEFDPPILAVGEGDQDDGYRRGPFGGGYRVALMMDDRDGSNGRPRDCQRRVTTCGFCRLRNVVRTEYSRGWLNDVSLN